MLSYFEGQYIYSVIQAVHSILYIVDKCHFFSVVTWKGIIKYLQKCEGLLTSVRYCTLHMLFTFVIISKMRYRGTWRRRIVVCKIVIILCSVAHKKYSCIFIKLRLNFWRHMDYFTVSLRRYWPLIVYPYCLLGV